jgi:hypothetical protein
MHGADHLIDDRLAAIPHHGMPVRRLIPEGSARHGYCAQNRQVCVKPAMWTEPTPRRAKSAIGTLFAQKCPELPWLLSPVSMLRLVAITRRLPCPDRDSRHVSGSAAMAGSAVWVAAGSRP